jgi:MFS family permease
MDRNIISILIEPIKQDLQLSDTEMGLLTGFSFALLYSVAGLPIGRLADRSNRKNILSAALALWSAMTALCGATNSFLTLFLARAGVGAGEAGGVPTTNSLIADYFKPGQRAAANSWVGLGSTMGAALGLAVGGVVNHYVGWRWALVVAGIPGFILAIVIFLTVAEPQRGLQDGHSTPPPALATGVAIKRLFGNTPLLHLIAGGALGNVGNAIIMWLPAYYSRAFDLSTAEIGLWLTPIQGISAAVGVLGAGWLADRLYARDPRWHPWMVALTELACVPFIIAVLLAPNQWLSFAFLVPAMMLKFAYLGPYYATMQRLAGPQLRATASAMGMFSVSIIGFGLGPVLIGAISDYFSQSEAGLQKALCMATPILVWAAYHSYRAARPTEEMREPKGVVT